MQTSETYDYATFVQWLWYKLLCHECSPDEFQRLFERIMERRNPDFMPIRPYGNIGDRKSDGMFLAGRTIFQVYSPDTLKQAETMKKIDEDLDGAVEHWGDEMKKWVFVYNARRGVAPDIPALLVEKGKEYPDIEIDHFSNNALWEEAMKLPKQQRAEVLGPIVAASSFGGSAAELMPLPHESPGDNRWVVLIQDINTPADVESVLKALAPDQPLGAPVLIRPETSNWEEAVEHQSRLLGELLEKSRQSFSPRFAVFSVAPIPLVIHLGFMLADVPVRCFKLHIDTKDWKWPEVDLSLLDHNIHVTGYPETIIRDECEVLIRVALSARIDPVETEEVTPDIPVQIDLFVDQPSRKWLRSPTQLDSIADVFRRTLESIQSHLPKCRKIHLFYAGPAPGAVVIGQLINPRMLPPIQLYEYDRNKHPRYARAIVLPE